MLNRKQMIETITRNLQNAGITEADVRVQPDPVRGWRVAVITSKFDSISVEARKEIVLRGLEEADLTWLDLLTLEEKEWVGPLPAAGEEEYLPLWSEMLAKGERAIDYNPFPTDGDEDLKPPVVVTFYSLRGGVGRSTAMAYTAKCLASKGRKVVCVDMDLEAPGLVALFGMDEEEVRLREDKKTARGVVQLLVELDQGGDPDFAQHLVPVEKYGNLFLLPAGIVGADYARKLRLITPNFWYREERNPLLLFMEKLSTGLPFVPDVILMDARTGLSEVSGPLLFGLSDMAMITFFPHPQAKQGTEWLTRSILRSVVKRPGRSGPHAPMPYFLVSPIPSTMPEARQLYQDRALKWIADWLEEIQTVRVQQELDVLREEEITHFVAYNESFAISDSVLDSDQALSPYTKLAKWIEYLLPQSNDNYLIDIIRNKKGDILKDLRIATGVIAELEENLLFPLYVNDYTIHLMSGRYVFIFGRKGTGKTLLFRFFREYLIDQEHPVVVHAPQGMRDNPPWMMTCDGFKKVGHILSETGAEWRHFWAYYCSVAIYHVRGKLRVEMDIPELGDASENISKFLDVFHEILKKPGFDVMLFDSLKRVETQLKNEHLSLLVDGLDIGFGHTPGALQHRQTVLEGLFSFWNDIQHLVRFKFKIFLGENIWRKLAFQNKSYLFGRVVELKWINAADFLRVIVGQVMMCKSFKESLLSIPELSYLKDLSVYQWYDFNMPSAWNLLVGERMGSARGSFTRDWVWSRLADANGEHTPRSLLQLFHHALAWEKEEQQKNPWEKSIIRPRALVQSLGKVSEDAVASLREEYQELGDFLNRLAEIGDSPFPTEKLAGQTKESIQLAREVGLLKVEKKDFDGVAMLYSVPDIYRLGLGMTRKGYV